MTTIADVIARVESNNNPQAVRFEPTVYARASGGGASPAAQTILARIAKLHKCSMATAAMIYSTSWGSRQIMGFNVWDSAYTGTAFDFLMSETAQTEAFLSFLRRVNLQDITPEWLAASHSLRLKFAIKYNGSIAYEAPMLEALKHFGFTIDN